MCGKVYPYNMKIAVSLILSNIELKYIKIFHQEDLYYMSQNPELDTKIVKVQINILDKPDMLNVIIIIMINNRNMLK